jgi:hypothetical protein
VVAFVDKKERLLNHVQERQFLTELLNKGQLHILRTREEALGPELLNSERAFRVRQVQSAIWRSFLRRTASVTLSTTSSTRLRFSLLSTFHHLHGHSMTAIVTVEYQNGARVMLKRLAVFLSDLKPVSFHAHSIVMFGVSV